MVPQEMIQKEKMSNKPWCERVCLVGCSDSCLIFVGEGRRGVYFSLSELFHGRHWCI